jgi:hypothetical protein
MVFIIFQTENFQVIQIDKYLYNIEFKKQVYFLINSILKTKLLQGGFTDESYTNLRFQAESVKSLKEYQDEYKIKHGNNSFLIPDVAKMIQSLTKQLSYLIENEFKTIIGYNLEEIIVINDEKFLFLGNELIANIDKESKMTMISCPYETNDFFFSPEILKIKELPNYVHYKTSYFSLACLFLYVLIGDDEFYKDYLIHKDSEQILTYLKNHSVKETRIYWFLSRCLVEESKNRTLIII